MEALLNRLVAEERRSGAKTAKSSGYVTIVEESVSCEYYVQQIMGVQRIMALITTLQFSISCLQYVQPILNHISTQYWVAGSRTTRPWNKAFIKLTNVLLSTLTLLHIC
jgi:hypothetical protein